MPGRTVAAPPLIFRPAALVERLYWQESGGAQPRILPVEVDGQQDAGVEAGAGFSSRVVANMLASEVGKRSTIS